MKRSLAVLGLAIAAVIGTSGVASAHDDGTRPDGTEGRDETNHHYEWWGGTKYTHFNHDETQRAAILAGGGVGLLAPYIGTATAVVAATAIQFTTVDNNTCLTMWMRNADAPPRPSIVSGTPGISMPMHGWYLEPCNPKA